jgi:hypothetical protein
MQLDPRGLGLIRTPRREDDLVLHIVVERLKFVWIAKR